MKNSTIKKRNLINSSASLLLILTSAILMFYPISKEQFIYEWQPFFDGNEARLTLVEFEPDEFLMRIPCDIVTKTENWVFEAKGGKAFQISINKGDFVVLLGNLNNEIDIYRFLGNELPNCESLELKILNNDREMQIFIDQNLFNVEKLKPNSRFEVASYVIWNPEISNKNVHIYIKTSSNLFLEANNFRNIIEFIIGLTLIISVLIYFQKNKKFYLFRILKFNNLDFLSVIYLIFLASFLHTIIDDGLYLLELTVFEKINILTAYLYPVPFPIGEWHFFITSLFFTEQPSILFMRIIPALTLIFIWKIFTAIWLEKMPDQKIRKQTTIFTWTIWAFFSATFLLSLRPEVYVALLLLINLALVKNYFESGYKSKFLLTIAVGALAISLHQTGIVVIFFIIIPWLHLLLNKNIKLINIHYFILVVSASIYIVFKNNNIFTLLDKIKDFESVNDWPLPFHETLSWNEPPWMEWKRIEHIFLADPLRFAAGLTAVLLAVILAFSLLAKWSMYKIEDKLFISSLLSASIGISLAPSKWVDHYAALLPIFLVAIVYLTKQFNSRFLIVTLFLVATFQLLGFNRKWVAGGKNIYSLDLTNPIVQFFYNLVTNTYLLKNLSIITLLFLILFLFFKYKNKNNKALELLTIVLIFISIIRQMLPTTADVLLGKLGWSMGDQVINGVFDKDERCGIFAQEQLDLAGIDLTKDSFAFVTPQDYAIYPCLRPTPIEAGKWNFPDYSVGNIHRWDQQRLMNRMLAENIYCFNPEERFFIGADEVCIYKWTSEIPDMKLKG